MTSDYEVRPFLGKSQPVVLGGLFDARSETMTPRSILKGTYIPPEAIARIDEQGLSYTYTMTDSLKEKMSCLGITGELGISALCGKLGGSVCGNYLSESNPNSRVRQASTVLKFTRVTETLRLDSACLKDLLTLDALHDTGATHVICGIEWGARTVFTAKERTDNTTSRRSTGGGLVLEPPGSKGSASVSPSQFVKLIGSLHASGQGGSQSSMGSFESDLSLEVKTDVVDIGNWDVPTSFDGMKAFLQNIPSVVDSLNGGKGVPIAYHIVPITFVATMFKVDMQRTFFADQLQQDDFEMCVDTLMRLQEQTHRAGRYAASVKQHEYCVPRDHIKKAGEEWEKAKKRETKFRRGFEIAVSGIRDQSPNSPSQQNPYLIKDLIDETGAGLLDESVVEAYNETMDFADHVTGHGGKYIPFRQLDSIVNENSDADLYLLHFSREAKGEAVWEEERQTIISLLKGLGATYKVCVVDYDVPEPRGLERIHVELRRGGRLIRPDVTQYNKDLSKLCRIECDAHHEADRTRSITRPSSRRVVRIDCPGKNCYGGGKVKWVCSECRDCVCYESEYLYCICSRYHFKAAAFKCNNPAHGPNFDKYEQDTLHQRLQTLDSTEEYTVLIIGKTGVGKSMFVNFLANYLEFKTLGAAMKKKKSLRHQIPCSFSWESKGRKEVKVQVGMPSMWERMSCKGQSSTGRTLTHCFEIDGKTFRFIDTPGIMDTSGTDQDMDNLKDILKMLEAAHKLNAILFMISPNESRLDDHFQAYISELLFRIHKNTANNIIFGFANASASNFSIGASQWPLDEVLERLQTGLKRGEGNQFFFESSPFMFLAAYKQKHATDQQRQHYAELWDKSGQEVQRFLQTVMELPAHDMQETLKLHRTVSILDSMAKPLAAFATSSKTSQAELRKAECELEKVIKNSGELAEKALVKVTMEKLVRCDLPNKRTVCTHESCVTKVQDDKGATRTEYSQICHSVCNVNTAADGIPGDDNLQWCRPFKRFFISPGHECAQKGCGHSWKDHMHISYELRKETRQVTDLIVLDKIKLNDEKKAALEGQLQTARDYHELLFKERCQIQAARALISVHLAHSTVASRPIGRDATMIYLNFQINEARKDGRQEEADELETQRREHVAAIEALQTDIRSKATPVPDGRAVDQSIEGLGKMQVLGEDLRAALEPDKVELDAPRFIFTSFKSWYRFGR